MKSLMLLNPRKKKRRSKRKASARRTTRRRSTRRTTARRTTRRTARRTSRRSSRAIRLKRGKSVTIMANPRRRSRRSGGMRFGAGNILSQVKGVFSRENLTVAGGGVAATVLTNFLMSRTKEDGTPILPMPADANTQKAVRIAYAVGIPVVGAILSRRFNPSLARGMVFGGLINGIVEVIKGYAPAETKKALGFAEYLEYTPMSALNGTPGYSAINQFSNVRPMNSAFANSSAFPADAWGR
jgi:hypothetical protein